MFFFKGRRQRLELEKFLRQVSEYTNPQAEIEGIAERVDSRIMRIFPVFLAPWENGIPHLAQSSFGLTRDVSEHGFSIVLNKRPAGSDIVVGLWPTNELLTAASSHPGFLVGEIRRETEIGAAYYRLGVLVKNLVSEQHPMYEKLAHHARQLLPSDQLALLKQSVTKHPQRVELENYLRRIADVTNPHSGLQEASRRVDRRVHRLFPVLIAPWSEGAPVWSQCTFGLTHDVSEHGMAVILGRRFPQAAAVVGLWPTTDMLKLESHKPAFIMGEVRQEVEMGAGYYREGILLRELLPESHPAVEKLTVQSRCLLPPDQLLLLKQRELAHHE